MEDFNYKGAKNTKDFTPIDSQSNLENVERSRFFTAGYRFTMIRWKAGGKPGFTLIELLVAMALTAGMMAAVSYIFFQAGTITSNTTARVDVHSEARFILDKMAREISASVLRSTGVTPRFIGVNHPAGGGVYDIPRVYRRDGIGFIVEDSTDGLVQVCYSLNLRDSNPSQCLGLIRYRTVPGAALDASFTMMSPGGNPGADIPDTVIDQTTLTTPDWRTVSPNVLSLQILYYLDLDGDGRVHEDPTGDSDGDGNNDDDFDGRIPVSGPPTLGKEDPDGGLLYPALPAVFWPIGAFPPNPELPALVEIRIVLKDPDNRDRRLFSRYIHVPAYLDR